MEDKKTRKGHVISVRIPEELGKKFDMISSNFSLNKTDFMTACIKKLVSDNDLYVKNYAQILKLIDNVKKNIERIPEKYLIVRNGKAKDITEIGTLCFCDKLFATSEKFWSLTKKIAEDWEIFFEGKLLEKFDNNFLFDVEDFLFMMVPRSKEIEADDFIDDDCWIDSIETKKILLLLSADAAFKKYGSEKILQEIIEKENNETKANNVMVIDAKGHLTRGRDHLKGPVSIDSIKNLKLKRNGGDN